MRNTDNAFKTLRQLKHRHPMPQFQRTVKLQNDISAVVGFAKPDVAAIKKNRYRFSAFFLSVKGRAQTSVKRRRTSGSAAFSFGVSKAQVSQSTTLPLAASLKPSVTLPLRRRKAMAARRRVPSATNTGSPKAKSAFMPERIRRNAAVLVSRYCSSDIPRRRQPPQISA